MSRRWSVLLLVALGCEPRGSSHDAPAAASGRALPPASTPAIASPSDSTLSIASASPVVPSLPAPVLAPAASAARSAPPAPGAPLHNPSVRERARDLLAHLPAALPGAGSPAGPISPSRDAAWVQRMTGDDIASASFHGGGVSVTIVLRFADGSKAMVKPAQKLVGSNHRAEIAAYHLDRLLGLGRVAPVVGRTLSLAWLREQLAGDERALGRLAEVTADGDRVPSALIAWHDRAPVVASPPAAWLDGMTAANTTPTESQLAWSDMVLFDTLLDNTDRWSGGNVMTLGPGGPLIFLDNASALLTYRARQQAFLAQPLERLCVVRPSTLAALRAAASPPGLAARLSASLAHDLLAPVLSPPVLAALDERLARVLGHLDACRE